MQLANVKFATKIFGSFMVVVALFTFIGAFQILKTRGLGILQDEGAKRGIETIKVMDLAVELNGIYTIAADAIINRTIEQARQEISAAVTASSGKIQMVKAIADTAEEKAQAEAFAGQYTRYLDTIATKLLPELAKGATNERTVALDDEIDKLRETTVATLRSFTTLLAKENEVSDRLYDDVQQQALVVALVLTITGMILALFFAWLITRSVTQPLSRAVAIAEKVADGDLTVEAPVLGCDEVGQLMDAMRRMIENLRRIAQQTIESSNQVNSAAEQISVASQNISQRVTQQASSLEETSATMEEMAASIRQTAENAREATRLGGMAREATVGGMGTMTETIRAMDDINKSSGKIANISGVIGEIAFQTNLLALNAAVEAARAGDHGKGFAVVAAEIRSLAQRAAQSAKEITSLISDSVDKTGRGVKLAEELDKKLADIGKSILNVVELSNEVAAAAGEQASGVNQVNIAISQLDQTTQQNASFLEETAASAEELAGEARELFGLISFFKVSDGTAARRFTQEKGAFKGVRRASGPAVRPVVGQTAAAAEGAGAFSDF